ncbi:Fe(2+) transporter FeoB [uncultured archaeon]|nr:Fe(2+) transporter FeoB [uncultured archaeon]
MEIRVALIGNPNVGKTALFNALTGSRQHVGNWPGVTVEKKEGFYTHNDVSYHVVDLPGTYGLTARSTTEAIARNFLFEEKPGIVVNIIDSSNIERNLYLTLLLLEAEANVIVALNMTDIATHRGNVVDAKKLGELLGVPVVPTVAAKGVGIEDLKEAVRAAPKRKNAFQHPSYGEAEKYIRQLEEAVRKDEDLLNKATSFWIATRILEGDPDITALVSASNSKKKILDAVSEAKKGLCDEPRIVLADARYAAAEKITRSVLVQDHTKETSTSEKLDRILLHKILAIPLVLFLMWAAFNLTFTVSAPFVSLIESGFSYVGAAVDGRIANAELNSLVVYGVIGGWGSIVAFLPPIFFMFLVLSFLEESGYMVRAAFVMDRFMSVMGLSGRSFIPFVLGFGCNVPAILSTRAIDDRKERFVTLLVTPLMSCQARLPVYILVGGAFFGEYAGSVVFSLYLLGIVFAVLMAQVLRKFVFLGEPEPLFMELPPYHAPDFAAMLRHAWRRCMMFLRKAATVLFVGSLLMWFVCTHPWGVGGIGESYAGMVGKVLQPLFSPLGFTWRGVVALLSGFIAKEIVVGTMGVLYGVGGNEAALQVSIAHDMTPLTAYAFMAFVLIYTPCLATISVIWSETASRRWALFSVGYSIALAYLVALAITFGGAFVGSGVSSCVSVLTECAFLALLTAT